jgi:hypothetical protein
MPTHDRLLARIRGEYREMPGLRLTFEQACRLWHLDAARCRSVLDALVAEKFIHRTLDGSYTSVVATRAAQVKASLESSRPAAVRTSRSA